MEIAQSLPSQTLARSNVSRHAGMITPYAYITNRQHANHFPHFSILLAECGARLRQMPGGKLSVFSAQAVDATRPQ